MFRTAFFLVLMLITGCRDQHSENDSKAKMTTVDTVVKTRLNSDDYTIDTIYKSDGAAVLGDTTIEKTKIKWVSVRFRPYIRFEDFEVELNHSKSAKLNLDSNKYGREYKTRLREGFASDTSNFAGHYNFVDWGCGSPCQMAMVIDRQTGKVYDAPTAPLGYEFKAYSRMLIVNPPDSDGFYDDCAYCTPEIYIFNEETKQFEERKP